ncbi:MAG: hypothetical protein WCL44_07060 [bacterium]
MSKSGQAIVEFVVAIIAVIVLVAGLIHIGVTSKVHTDVMTAAREEAGLHALNSVVGGSDAGYIASVQDGADGVNYSADDELPDGNTMGVLQIARCAHPAELGAVIGDNAMTATFANPDLVVGGLVNGTGSATVHMLPVIQNLVNGEESFEVVSDVWMVDLGESY